MSPGTVIDQRYELLAEIGRGGSGSVHRARDRETGAVVAVKLLELDEALDLERFRRESSLLAQMRHPNIVAYIAHGEVGDGMYFLVEEWVAGGTLRARLQSPPGVSAREAVAMGLGVAEALASAHALDVVHRDVKPENILLDGTGSTQIKLVDFGIARLSNPELQLTRTGTLIGTPAYMAPEQARGSRLIGAAADVWGLGCVLFEMLTGRTPFGGPHLAAIRAKVILEEPPDLLSLCPEAPSDLIALVVRMLSKDPSERPANGRELARLLRSLSAIPDGPRRMRSVVETGGRARPVRALPSAEDLERINCLMFVATIEAFDADTATDHAGRLAKIASKHHLELDIFDDGGALLHTQRCGRPGALDIARAAEEFHAEVPSAVLSVVGHTVESRSEAIDRAAAALEHSSLQALFSDVGPDAAPVSMDAIVSALAGQAERL